MVYWQWLTHKADYEIISPRLGIPAIKTGNQSLDIQVRSNQIFYNTDFAIHLKKGAFRRPLAISRVKNNGNSFTLFSHIPANFPIGKYDLELQQNNQTWVRENAVYVIKKHTKNLKMIQFADLPWLSDSVRKEAAGDLMLDKIIEDVNLINPDIVTVSGDNVYGGTWGQYSSLYDALLKLEPPLIIVPGNHEYEGWKGYLSFFGKTRHTIDYGDYRFISINSGHARDQLTFSQFTWLKQQFELAPEKTFIVQLHHPVFGDYGPLRHLVSEMVELFKQYDVQIVLSGHSHADKVFDQTGKSQKILQPLDGPPYAVVTSAGQEWRKQWASSKVVNGYRLIRFDNKKLINYTYDYDGDGKRDASSSIPLNHLDIEKISNTEYVVSNNLNESFSNAKVTFSANSEANWQTNIGIISHIEEQGEKQQITVNFTLPANSDLNIKLTNNKDVGL